MMRAPKIDLNGIELSADKVITPRTMKFLEANNVKVEKEGDHINLSGNFCFSKQSIDAFLEMKNREDKNKTQASSAVKKDKTDNFRPDQSLPGLRGMFK